MTRTIPRRPRPIALARPPASAAAVQVPDRGFRVDRPSAQLASGGGTAQVYLYDAIDASGWWGVSAADFLAEVLALDVAVIELHINSPGGDYFEAVAIYNGLVNHPATINVIVDGLAASAASLIAMAGDRLVMGVGAQVMIHQARTVAIGPAGDLRAAADVLDKVDGDLAAVYAGRAARTGVGSSDPASWSTAMAAESWYTAAEAVAAGLADEASDPARLAGEPEAPAAADDEPGEGDDESPFGEGEGEGEGDDEPAPDPAMSAAAARWVAQWRRAPGGRSAAAVRPAAPAARRPAAAPPPAPPAVPRIDPDTIRSAFRKARQ